MARSHQQGDKFSDEILVASSISNEWNPAIAAAPNGDVTIAWDSYRNGNYDVYLRSFDSNAKLAPERGAVATARYEAYPSLAYDKEGRLWLAWEESDAEWGKDFGADETTGIGLYHGRWIKVKVWQGNRAFTPLARTWTRNRRAGLQAPSGDVVSIRRLKPSSSTVLIRSLAICWSAAGASKGCPSLTADSPTQSEREGNSDNDSLRRQYRRGSGIEPPIAGVN